MVTNTATVARDAYTVETTQMVGLHTLLKFNNKHGPMHRWCCMNQGQDQEEERDNENIITP